MKAHSLGRVYGGRIVKLKSTAAFVMTATEKQVNHRPVSRQKKRRLKKITIINSFLHSLAKGDDGVAGDQVDGHIDQ